MGQILRISAFINQWKKDRRVRTCITVAAVFVSALIQSYALQVFVRPAGIISGGFTGMAMLVERLGELKELNIPMQVTMLLLNIPVAILCCKGISIRFTIFSLVQVFLSSIFLQIFNFSPIFTDEVLNVIFGGVIFGSAIVIALRGNASTGGTDFIALFVSNRTGLSIWSYVFFGNAVMYCFYGAIFGWKHAGYSIIFQFCNTQVINTFYKKYKKKTLLIVTDNPAAVSADLLELTNHSSTILKGFGSYSANKKYLIYTVLSDSDVRKMKKRIREQYPDTFVNVINSSDVVGNFYIQPLE